LILQHAANLRRNALFPPAREFSEEEEEAWETFTNACYGLVWDLDKDPVRYFEESGFDREVERMAWIASRI
jgi:hypothetical protein